MVHWLYTKVSLDPLENIEAWYGGRYLRRIAALNLCSWCKVPTGAMPIISTKVLEVNFEINPFEIQAKYEAALITNALNALENCEEHTSNRKIRPEHGLNVKYERETKTFHRLYAALFVAA